MGHNCVEYAIYAHTIHDDENDYDRIVVRNLRGGILTSLVMDILKLIVFEQFRIAACFLENRSQKMGAGNALRGSSNIVTFLIPSTIS